ncbi:Nitrogen fixation regulation protein FixK [Alphaproteobacteria bacterium SO-S41]|nr:Nitrogen fixation regulation protein FixK [Alphaproteobacteria bacterium SO-S41]
MTNLFVAKLGGHATLTTAEIAKLTRACQGARGYPAGHDLIHEGDASGGTFVVLEGWACRYKSVPGGGRQIVAFLLPGDFGDLHAGVLTGLDHSIATVTKALIATIPAAEMDELVTMRPAVTEAFWWAQLVDESILRAWVVSMGRRSSMERVAHLMCELYARMRNIGLADADSCEMPLTQLVLADALGLTPVHVNRVLRKLRTAGIMLLSDGVLRVLDPAGLTRLAGFDDNYLHRRPTRTA